MSRRKIALWIAGGIAALVVVAFVAGIIVLKVMFPDEKIRRIAEEQARTFIRTPVRIADVGLSLWPLGIKADTLVVENPPMFGREPFLRLDRLVVDVALLRLITGHEIAVEQILVERPRVLVVADTAGRSNLDSLFVVQPEEPEQAGGMPLDLTVDELHVENGTVTYRDLAAKTEVLLDSIDETTSLRINKAITRIAADGTLKLGRIVATTGGMTFGPLGLDIDHELLSDSDADSLRFSVLADLAGLPIRASGRIHSMSTRPDVFAEVHTDTVDVTEFIRNILPKGDGNRELEASGRIALDARLRAIVDTTVAESPLNLDGVLAFRDIRVKYPDLPKAIDRVNGLVSFTEDSIDVQSFEARAGRSMIALTALLRDWRGDAPALVQSAVKGNVDLDELRKMVAMPDGMTVGGRLSIDVAAAGPVAQPMDMDVRGRIVLDNVAATAPEYLNVPIRRMTGAIDITPDVITTPDLGIWAGKSEIHVERVRMADYLALALPDEKGGPKPRLDFAIRSPILDLDELIVSDTAAFVDTTLVIDLGLFPDMIAEGTARIDRLIYFETTMTGVQARIRMADQRISASGTAMAYRGRTGFDGWIDVTDPKDPRYAIRWDAHDIQANDALSSMTDFKDRIYGLATSAGSFTGHGATYGEMKRNLTGDATYSARDGYLKNWPVARKVAGALEVAVNVARSGWGTAAVARMGLAQDTIRFGSLAGGFTLREGRLLLQNTVAEIAEQRWGVEGTVAVEGALDVLAKLVFSEEMTREIAEGASGVVSTIAPVNAQSLVDALPENRLSVAMPVRGTFTNPTVGAPDLLQPFRAAAQRVAGQQVREVRDRAAEETRNARDRAAEEARNRVKDVFGR